MNLGPGSGHRAPEDRCMTSVRQYSLILLTATLLVATQQAVLAFVATLAVR